jgi:hypothetical protein
MNGTILVQDRTGGAPGRPLPDIDVRRHCVMPGARSAAKTVRPDTGLLPYVNAGRPGVHHHRRELPTVRERRVGASLRARTYRRT